MGQGCSSCATGNPCTDPTCSHLLGSKAIRKLIGEVKEKNAEIQDKVRNDERIERRLKELDDTFAETNSLTRDAFKHHSNNVKNYFSKPQPTIEDLDSVELRLMTCLDNHKTCEYLECHNNALDLSQLATQGRDQPAHCKIKPNPYSCTYEAPENSEDAGATAGGGFPSKPNKNQPFGSCYA